MTIHQIIYDVTFGGGAEKIARLLHDGLLEHGVDARLLSLAGDVSQIPAAQSARLNNARDPRAILEISRYLKNNCTDDDIVHVHLYPATLFAAAARRLSGWKGKLICTEHNTHAKHRSSWSGKLIDSYLFAGYSSIVCCSEDALHSLQNWIPRFSDRMCSIPNGVSLNFDSFPADSSRGSTPVILSMGRLCSQKNYPTALQTIARLKESRFEYWIAGSGDDEELLKRMAVELNIEKHVRFLGFVEDTQQLLSEADIFFMPSLHEGLPLAALEAMNAGLPAVVSNTTGLQNLFSSKSAFLQPFDRPDLFASALDKLLLSPQLRREMGKEAFKQSKEFSSEKMIQNYLELYRTLQSV